MLMLKKFWLLWVLERLYSSLSNGFTVFLSHMAAIACLFILCANLLLLLLAVLAWLGYTVLIGYGFPPEQAGLLLFVRILVLLACLTLLLKRAFSELQDSIHIEMHKNPSISDIMTCVAESFIEGFQDSTSSPKRAKRRK